jgi:hypothetical protein
MAHFGLTALGPQSPYLFKHRYTVSLFPLEEFGAAFDVKSRGSGVVAIGDVDSLLQAVFHGSTFDEGVRVSSAIASKLGDDAAFITRAAFLEVIAALQADDAPVQEDRQKAAHYTSHDLLSDHKSRSIRPTAGPQEFFSEPLTLAAEVGWRANETPLGDVRYPKKHCAETKYAAALISSGVL